MRCAKTRLACRRFALAPDSNISARADGQTILIDRPVGPPLSFRVNDDSRLSSGIGLLVWGGGEYQHPLPDLWGERLRLRARVRAP